MKISHICLCGPYTDGWNYQENLITKYQAKNGYDVSIIASQYEWGNEGKIIKNENTEYVNNDNCKVYRLKLKRQKDINYKFKNFLNIYETLEKISPDILFIHNVQFLDIKKIVKYAKNHSVKIFIDNHADFSNSGKNILSKYILHGIIWKHMAKIIEPYTTKFYGVLPARVDFLVNIYGLPKEKVELLVMGADDDKIKEFCTKEKRSQVRNRFEVETDDFLIITGGKIDMFKRQTLLLINAVKNIKSEKVKLIVFGSIVEELKDEVNNLCDGKKIQYVGWANDEQSYEYFNSADLAVFPGRHSVYWEQVTAIGVPMICKYWNGTTHIDIGGNVKFLKEDSILEIQKTLEEIINNKSVYEEMKNDAMKKKKENFLYSAIAARSIK